MNLARYLAEWRDRGRLLLKPDALSRIHLRPGDIAIDCGANVGNITRRLARPGVTVHAFEPNPDAFGVLSQRFRNCPLVSCYNQGVLDCNTRMRLYLHVNANQEPVKWSTGSSLYLEKGNVRSDQYVEVDIIDLAEFITRLDTSVKVLKLDVEGAEYRVLRRLVDMDCIMRIENILVEAHEHRMPFLQQEAADVRKLLLAIGRSDIYWDWI